MKKKVLVLIISIAFMLLFEAKTYAESIYFVESGDSYGTLASESYNLVQGLEPTHEQIEYFNNKYGEYFDRGTIYTTVKGTVDGTTHIIQEELYFESSVLVNVMYYFDSYLFFDCTAYTPADVNETLDISRYLGKDYEVFTVTNYYTHYDIEDFKGYHIDQELLHIFPGDEFSFVRTNTYKYNEKYKDNDLHIPVDFDNPLSMEDILKNMSIEDASSTTYEIVDNTYDPTNVEINKVYSFRLIVADERGYVTEQIVYVDVTDIKKPVIQQKESIVADYRVCLTEEEIKEKFTITDNDPNATVEYVLDDYMDAYDVPGTHSCKVIAKDSYYTTEYTFTILVEDNVAPLLSFPTPMYTNVSTPITKEFILSQITAIDDVDGDCKVNVILTDTNDYQNHTDVLGTYIYQVYVEDSRKNYASSTLTIYVVDMEYPEISFGPLVVLTQKGEPCTRAQIIEIFKAMGYELEEDDLEGECFDLASLEGTYDFIAHIGDEIEAGKITTEGIEIDYTPPAEEKEDTKKSPYLVVGIISGSILVLCSILGIIIYRKRH